MRRKEREVTDFGEIIKIIDECEIIRIGLADGDYPYIVPVNFSYIVTNGKIEFYIHGAMAGRKYELMKKNGKCSFEMDIPLKIELNDKASTVTMRYKSVMGTADIEFLHAEQKQWAIDNSLMARHELTKNFDYNKKSLAVTSVAKLTITEITAKANL